MNQERTPKLSPTMEAAIEEIRAMILDRYPSTEFRVSLSQDDPTAIHLNAVVDVDDTDQVVDLVIDRMMELQIEDDLPLFVIPVRTPSRVAAELEGQKRLGRFRPSRIASVPDESRPLAR